MLYIEANLAERRARPVSEGRDRMGYLIAAPDSSLSYAAALARNETVSSGSWREK